MKHTCLSSRRRGSAIVSTLLHKSLDMISHPRMHFEHVIICRFFVNSYEILYWQCFIGAQDSRWIAPTNTGRGANASTSYLACVLGDIDTHALSYSSRRAG
jgi:hypothetical protein